MCARLLSPRVPGYCAARAAIAQKKRQMLTVVNRGAAGGAGAEPVEQPPAAREDAADAEEAALERLEAAPGDAAVAADPLGGGDLDIDDDLHSFPEDLLFKILDEHEFQDLNFLVSGTFSDPGAPVETRECTIPL